MAVTADNAMNGWGAAMGAWHRLREALDRRGVTVFAAVWATAILAAALVAALVENTILDPNVTIVGGTLSPNGKWVALTEQIAPGPSMGDVDTAIELRHHDGLLMGPTLDRMFLIKYRSDKVTLLRVRWYTDTLLEIRYRSSKEDMPKLTKQYDEVLVDYLRDDRR